MKKSLKQILSNTIWMFFDKVFILILNLVVTVQIANYYGSFGYGTYQYAVSIVALFEVLVTFVDGRVVKRKYTVENPNELVWNVTITRLLFSVLSLGGGIVYIILCGEGYEYQMIFLVLLINAILINLRFGMQNRYEYLLKSKKIIIASNIGLTVGGVCQLVAVKYQLSIIAIAVLTAISSLISLSIVYVQYRREFGRLVQGKYKGNLVKELISESIPLAIAASCAIIYSRCDSIMVGNMLSKDSVGVYAIAVKLINVVQIGIAPIRESVYPKMIELYSKDKQQYRDRYIQISSIMTWVYIIGVSISFIVLPYLFQFLSDEYTEALPIYRLYVVGTFFMYNAALRAGHFTLINRGNILMCSQIMSVILNIVLNFILIRVMGLYGAAIATAVTQSVSLLFANLLFKKDGKEVFIWQIKALNPKYIFIKL